MTCYCMWNIMSCNCELVVVINKSLVNFLLIKFIHFFVRKGKTFFFWDEQRWRVDLCINLWLNEIKCICWHLFVSQTLHFVYCKICDKAFGCRKAVATKHEIKCTFLYIYLVRKKCIWKSLWIEESNCNNMMIR